MDPHLESTPTKPGETSSFWVLGARLTWVFVGPVVLLGTTYGIISRGTGWLTGFDALFGIVAALMLLGRWTEQRSGAAMTISGEPATPEQFKRYATVLIPVVAVVWVGANLLGNHVLK